MYYEIDSIYELPTLIFDDERLTVKDKEYDYDKITEMKITHNNFLAMYAILEIQYEGTEINIPFNRGQIRKMKHCINEFKAMKAKPIRKQERSESGNVYGQIKQLKELLDIGAITQEEFDKKKKELLDL